MNITDYAGVRSLEAKRIRGESSSALLLFLLLDFNFLFTLLRYELEWSSHVLFNVFRSQCFCPQSKLCVLHALIFIAYCKTHRDSWNFECLRLSL